MRESSNDDQIQDFTPSPSLDAGVLLEAARRDKLALMNISNIQYDTPEKKTNGLVASQPISPQSVAVDLFKIDTIHKDTSVADMSIDEPQIQIDAANDNVALAVFATLTFFCFLFGGTVALCIVSVSNYGLVAFTAMGAVMVILGSAMHCFWSVAKSDPQLRPVRNRIERSLVVAQAVIINEIQAFQEEMNEHGLLLLENGSASDYVECEDAAKDDPRVCKQYRGENLSNNSSCNRPKQKRSILFKIVGKPFLLMTGRKKVFSERKKSSVAATTKNDAVFV